MAKRDGAMSMKYHIEQLSRLRGKYGVPARLQAAYPGIGAALELISNINATAKGLDDNPLVSDLDAPEGPEDGI